LAVVVGCRLTITFGDVGAFPNVF
jgi:hypothetical protein